jgi:hypothetical protein
LRQLPLEKWVGMDVDMIKKHFLKGGNRRKPSETSIGKEKHKRVKKHEAGRPPTKTSVLAYVTNFDPDGHEGPFAHAKCEGHPILKKVTFSAKLNSKVWSEDDYPKVGDYVWLDKIRRHRPSKKGRKKHPKDQVYWRAYKVRPVEITS